MRNVIWLSLLLLGCGVNDAVLEGHDFIDTASSNLRVGIEEYHREDVETLGAMEGNLARAFTAAVVKRADDPNAVEAQVNAFMAGLAKARQAHEVENQRYNSLLNSLRALEQVNEDMRSLNQIRLNWNQAAVEYTNRLRAELKESRP